MRVLVARDTPVVEYCRGMVGVSWSLAPVDLAALELVLSVASVNGGGVTG